MGYLLVWENNKWYYDRITNRDYSGEAVREPLYKVGDTVIYRRQDVKVEWCNCTVNDQNEHIFWYDVRRGNVHSISCLEEELSKKA
jgi:hypothetical protein